MNTPISFELAKLLKEKGFNLPTIKYYVDKNTCVDCLPAKIDGSYPTNDDMITDWCSAPIISEVVMWLCEKHRIWIEVIVESPNYFGYSVCNIKNNTSQDGDYVSYDSPTEAYEAAIEYVLTTLI